MWLLGNTSRGEKILVWRRVAKRPRLEDSEALQALTIDELLDEIYDFMATDRQRFVDELNRRGIGYETLADYFIDGKVP